MHDCAGMLHTQQAARKARLCKDEEIQKHHVWDIEGTLRYCVLQVHIRTKSIWRADGDVASP